MDYYELREIVKKIIPRQTTLFTIKNKTAMVKEKGRKVNYHQMDLLDGELTKRQRLLNAENINSFLEISLRAAYCPMPFNADVYDALRCPYRCRYCFADHFRGSLYTSFFDNSKEMGLRHCSPATFKTELDELMKLRNTPTNKEGNQKAISNNVPIRLGIRFEDFSRPELKRGIALQFLQYMKDNSYPIMINTKSDLFIRDEYVFPLANNKAGAAVHMTLISSNEKILKTLEPAAPTFKQRLVAMKTLSSAGIRVVARIEPFMTFINDDPEDVREYMELVWNAGIRHITMDSYSYSANGPGIREGIQDQGIDFDRMYEMMSDCQWLGSLLLSKFMDLFRDFGFKCSAFDFGGCAKNDDNICCCLDNYFDGAGFNPGNVLSAIRFIVDKKGHAATWSEFEAWVEANGGWLTKKIYETVFRSWNLMDGTNIAYTPIWAAGIKTVGRDDDQTLVYSYDKSFDFRIDNLKIY